jgi:hypothetical protein
VLHSPASNTDGFLSRDTCVSSIQLNKLLCNKRAYVHLEKPKLQKVFLWNVNSVLTGKQCTRYWTFIKDGFLWRDTYVSSMQLNRLIFKKESLCQHWKPYWQEEFLSKIYLIVIGKQCNRCSCFLHRWFSFERYMCFFNLAGEACFEQNSLLHLDTLTGILFKN